MTVTPLGNRLLVEPSEQETKTSGGVILPDTASKERPIHGTIVAVGPGARNKKGSFIPMQVKVGDHIVYSQYAGDEIELDGKKYLLLKEDEVLAVEQ